VMSVIATVTIGQPFGVRVGLIIAVIGFVIGAIVGVSIVAGTDVVMGAGIGTVVGLIVGARVADRSISGKNLYAEGNVVTLWTWGARGRWRGRSLEPSLSGCFGETVYAPLSCATYCESLRLFLLAHLTRHRRGRAFPATRRSPAVGVFFRVMRRPKCLSCTDSADRPQSSIDGPQSGSVRWQGSGAGRRFGHVADPSPRSRGEAPGAGPESSRRVVSQDNGGLGRMPVSQISA